MSARDLPPGWRDVLKDELAKPYFARLQAFLKQERAGHAVYPPESEVYAALRCTPFDRVKVLLLGQDPYPTAGNAHGLCFSVREGVKPPASLGNIFKELQADLGIEAPPSGCLTRWARQGVLLLNAVLTVCAGQPNSHAGKGWEQFTDAIMRKEKEKPDPVVFVLWGGYARKKEKLIDAVRHRIIQSAHPSPLSANAGFLGSRPFSKINDALREVGKATIDWSLPDPKKEGCHE